jgi:hypothetical protein
MASPPKRAPLRLLSGHTDSVVCLSASDSDNDRNTIASGGEDGWLVIHDPRAPAPCAVVSSAAMPSSSSGANAAAAPPCVAAVSFAPWSSEILYAAAGTQVVALDVRALKASAPSSSSASTPGAWNPLARSSPADAARDVVAALSVTGAGGGLLAAADDAGDVAVFELLRGQASTTSSSPQQHLLRRKVLLREAHGDAPCCAVAFAPPPLAAGANRPHQRHKTVMVLSGGCDSRVFLGDTGLPCSSDPGGGGAAAAAKRRPPRPVFKWEMGGEALASGAAADADANDGGMARVAAETAGGPRVCNPPFVMGLATATAVDGRGGETAVAAVARGDGVLAVFEPFASDGVVVGGDGAAKKGSGCPSVCIAAHKRAVSCARFARLGRVPDGQTLMLATGGDDGRACLWYWGSTGQPAAGAPRQAASGTSRFPPSPLAFKPALCWHASMPGKGAKVNAVVDVAGPGGLVLAVADTATTVKVYDAVG